MDFFVYLTGRSGILEAELPLPVDVAGYRVGAVQVHIPDGSWQDISDLSFDVVHNTVRQTGRVPAGNYQSLLEYCLVLEHAVNGVLGEAGLRVTVFNPTQTVTVRMNSSDDTKIIFSAELLAALGLTMQPEQGVETVATAPATVLRHQAFLRCSAVEKSAVNRTTLPLLTHIQLRPVRDSSSHVKYVHLAAGYLQRISVEIVDCDKKALLFPYGTVCVCLRFVK